MCSRSHGRIRVDRAFSTLMLLLLLGVLADILTTEYGLEQGAYELNPVMRSLMEKYGTPIMWLIKFLFMTVASTLYILTRNKKILLAWTLTHYAIATWNTIQLLIINW